MIRAILLLLLLPCISFGGAFGNESILQIPQPEAITVITVTQNKGKMARHITDRATITQVLALLAQHNSGWAESHFTFPTPSASASFSNHEQSSVFMLWFGRGWVGARTLLNGKSQNMLWRIKPEIHTEIRRLLAISEAR